VPHFMQMRAVNEEATLNLLQRAFKDYCRDAAVEARLAGHGIHRTSSLPMTNGSSANVELSCLRSATRTAQ
jgi:hypothetical protein